MKNQIIKKLINIWDPLGIYGLAPEDEYDDITAKLIDLIDAKASKNEIKEYLMLQYYSEKAKNEIKVNELYDVISLLKLIDD